MVPWVNLGGRKHARFEAFRGQMSSDPKPWFMQGFAIKGGMKQFPNIRRLLDPWRFF